MESAFDGAPLAVVEIFGAFDKKGRYERRER